MDGQVANVAFGTGFILVAVQRFGDGAAAPCAKGAGRRNKKKEYSGAND